jgi:hypothetical protein
MLKRLLWSLKMVGVTGARRPLRNEMFLSSDEMKGNTMR